ncbi:hypothetical protein M0802_011031 [Mischocyttarus mexicanus]|nr:hypothetical protein M0802_011031 [Mischocyttarus mexicanus]
MQSRLQVANYKINRSKRLLRTLRYIKIKFSQLNSVLQNMLTSTVDIPQHKRVLRMKDNWEDDSSLSTIYQTYKSNENLVKLKRVKQIHLELIKCGKTINDAYGLQIFISTAMSIVFVITLLYNVYAILITKTYNSSIKDFYAHFYWSFCFSFKVLIICIMCERTTAEQIRSFTVQLETCIRTMGQLNIPIKFSKYYWQQCLIILLWFIFLITIAIVDYQWFKLFIQDFWSVLLTFYIERYPFAVSTAVDITFLYWMMFIKTRFGELNKVLKSMLTTTIDSPQHKRVLRMKNNRKYDYTSYDIHRTYKSNEDLIKMKKIREIHLELIKCARNTNDAYGLHILMSISIAFVLTTTVAYNIYSHITNGSYLTQTTQTFVYLYWMFYFGFKIVIISYVCGATVKEVSFLLL